MIMKAVKDRPISVTRVVDLETLVAKSREYYGDSFDFSETIYKSAKEKLHIRCKKHDKVFNITSRGHLRKNGGCPTCYVELLRRVNTSNTETFIQKARKVYGDDVFSFNKTRYRSQELPVTITCKAHGEFSIAPKVFLRESNRLGCPTCNKSTSAQAGWHRSGFVDTSKGKTARLYIIHCIDGSEEFFKIGITSRRLEERFESTCMPYKWSVVRLFTGDPGFLWDLEKFLHRQHKEYHYTPRVPFGGSVKECFSRVLLDYQ